MMPLGKVDLLFNSMKFGLLSPETSSIVFEFEAEGYAPFYIGVIAKKSLSFSPAYFYFLIIYA